MSEQFTADCGTTYKKPKIKLIGTDGNVFGIIGRVRRVLQSNVNAEVANEFQKKAMSSDSYDAVLRLTMEYVDVC